MIDQPTLDAFVDGALKPEEAARVVMHLADTPAAQAHVDATMELNALLSAAFAAPMNAPVPERIRAVIEGGTRAGGNVVAFRRRIARLSPYLGGAIAAGVLVAVGVGLWPGAPVGPSDGLRLAGPVAVETTLYHALETRGSGDAILDAEGTEVLVVATFLDADQRPCREFEVLEHDEGLSTRGIACREATPEWTVAFAASRPMPMVPGAGGMPAGGAPQNVPVLSYVPAAGVTDAAVSAALDALGAGPGLSTAQEDALMTRGWKS